MFRYAVFAAGGVNVPVTIFSHVTLVCVLDPPAESPTVTAADTYPVAAVSDMIGFCTALVTPPTVHAHELITPASELLLSTNRTCTVLPAVA